MLKIEEQKKETEEEMTELVEQMFFPENVQEVKRCVVGILRLGHDPYTVLKLTRSFAPFKPKSEWSN